MALTKPRFQRASVGVLVAPFLALEFCMVVVPLAYGLYLSFFKVDYFEKTDFLGLENYRAILSSPEFFYSIGTTLSFTILSLIVTFVVGFALALKLEADSRLNIFSRAVVLVPFTISMLVGSLLMKWIMSSDSPITNGLVSSFGLDGNVLAYPAGAMSALVFNAMWRDSAFAMILLMAGLKSVPLQLYAAARIDGAGPIERFVKITLPLMRLPILITLVRLTIHFLNMLTLPLVLTGGGPGRTTTLIGLEMYHIGFHDYRLGAANAYAILILLANAVLVFAVVKLFQQKDAAR